MSFGAVDSDGPLGRYGWLIVVLLLLASSLAFVDRQALALLVEPIKADLRVSDTQVSLLYGLSFTIFYVAAGLPIARLADRADRRRIVAWSILTWSAMTVACGFSRSFGGLFAARVGVGAGEAGLSPAAYSMIADSVPGARLATALGLYAMGIYIGNGLALVIGGSVIGTIAGRADVVLPLLGAMRGWQLVFLIVGAPGFILGGLFFAVREPTRRGSTSSAAAVSLGTVLRHVRSRAMAYFGITFGFAFMIMIGAGSAAWIPAFFARSHGWSPALVGSRYGIVVLVCGILGAAAGGIFASRLRARGVAGGNLMATVVGTTCLLPAAIAFPLVRSPDVALGLIAIVNFFSAFNFGGGYAALQDITPNRMRAFVSACYMFVVNVVGGGLGPTAVALLTDRWFGDPARLASSLSIIAATMALPTLACLLLGLRGYRCALTADREAVAA